MAVPRLSSTRTAFAPFQALATTSCGLAKAQLLRPSIRLCRPHPRRAAHNKQPEPLAYSPSSSTSAQHAKQAKQPQKSFLQRPMADKDRWRALGYKGVQRRLVSAIVATPILIMTSWWLFERLALGKEQKQTEPLPIIGERRE